MRHRTPSLLRTVLLLSFCLLAARQGHAHLKVLTVPGHPISLFLEHDGEKILSSYLRSPEGIHPLERLIGLSLAGDSYSFMSADADFQDDLLWKIDFREQKGSLTVSLWITAVTETSSAWAALAPGGPTFWDILPLPSGKNNIFPYIAPHLPGYDGREPVTGSSILSFIYTMILTKNGPKMIAAPDFYRKLLPLTHLVLKSEEDEELSAAYGFLYLDFERMSSGQMPSREAMNNFLWKRILSMRWGR